MSNMQLEGVKALDSAITAARDTGCTSGSNYVNLNVVMESGQVRMLRISRVLNAKIEGLFKHQPKPPVQRSNGFRERKGIDAPRNKPFYRQGDKW